MLHVITRRLAECSDRSVTDLAAFRKIYSTTQPFLKAEYYDVFRNGAEFSIFTERNEKSHGQQRRHVARAYSKSSLMEMEDQLDVVIKTFINKLRSMPGTAIDLVKWLELLSYGESALPEGPQAMDVQAH